MNVIEYAKHYDQAGFKLCAIHPGTKHPKYQRWEQTPIEPHRFRPPYGLGLLHVQSRTAAIDLDDIEQANYWLEARGIDLSALLEDDDAVQIVSGKANRAKLLYRLPEGCPPLVTKKVTEGGKMLIELRCASNEGKSLQDVLPPTIHPETKQPYHWGGNGEFSKLPVLPAQVIKLWQSSNDPPQAVHANRQLSLGNATNTLEAIPEGGRNDWLFKRAGDMVGQGMPLNRVNEALQALNEQRCKPPLDQKEVTAIANSAMKTSHGARALAQGLRESREEGSNLVRVSVDDLFTNPTPAPEFIWEGLIPRGVVTLLAAHGGTGKSFMALMLAVSVALGRALWDTPTHRAKTLFLSLEDGPSVVRYRLAHICRLMGVDPADFGEWLHIVDGTEYPELFTAEGRGEGNLTPSYQEMAQVIQSEWIGFVIIDNASDAFGADEIQRRHVRGFIRSLVLAVRETNAACLLLAHVDKNTSRNPKPEGGESYSGSTAWHNSVRSRLFLSRDTRGLLKLEHQKSNYGQKQEPISLVWPEHCLIELASNIPNYDGLIDKVQGRADDENASKLLALIHEYESRGMFMATSTNSRANPFKVMESDPHFTRLKLTRRDTQRLITQCQRAKWIEMLDYQSSDRKPRQRWTLTEDGKRFAGVFAPSAPSDAH